MKKLIVVAIALITGTYFFLSSGGAPEQIAPKDSTASAKPDGKLAASAVLKIDPATRSVQSAPARTTSSPSPLMQTYLERKDWPGLFRKIKDAPPTPESQFLQADLLAACAKRLPSPAPAAASANAAVPVKSAADAKEERRARFFASLAPNDPQLEKRKTAYDLSNADRCGELSQIEYNADEVNRLLDAAAAGGDPRARSWLLTRQIGDDMQAASKKAIAENRPPTTQGNIVTDAQFATMRELLASQDPIVMADLRNLLSSTIDGGAIRIGPNQQSIDHQAFYNAWGLVACDFGAPCGADSLTIQQDCAAQGRCSANNLYDHTYYYGVSPHGAQLVEQYRQWLGQMIGARDLSQLNLVRGANNPNSTFMFGGRRRN
jgi:hypothetical protein